MKTTSAISPKTIRTARALLAWSQLDLSDAANVAPTILADFERSAKVLSPDHAKSIQAALETEGIQFLSGDDVSGPLSPHPSRIAGTGTPTRWIEAVDLSNWASTPSGAAALPTLIAHLVFATHGAAVRLRFPSGDGIWHAGWDGYTSTDFESGYVPKSSAGWEIGSQRSNIAAKAIADYHKRTKNAAPLNPATDTYIFVTPRHWPQKHEWLKDRQDEGLWKQVRVYDVDDLLHWIEQAPAVSAWLAGQIGKRPQGLRELEEAWDEWSFATTWPLSEELVLSDRDKDAARCYGGCASHQHCCRYRRRQSTKFLHLFTPHLICYRQTSRWHTVLAVLLRRQLQKHVL